MATAISRTTTSASRLTTRILAIQAQAEEEQKRIVARYFQTGEGKETIAGIRTELTHTMEEGAGIYRTESSLRATCEKTQELKERYGRVAIADHSLSFNTELE